MSADKLFHGALVKSMSDRDRKLAIAEKMAGAFRIIVVNSMNDSHSINIEEVKKVLAEWDDLNKDPKK